MRGRRALEKGATVRVRRISELQQKPRGEQPVSSPLTAPDRFAVDETRNPGLVDRDNLRVEESYKIIQEKRANSGL